MASAAPLVSTLEFGNKIMVQQIFTPGSEWTSGQRGKEEADTQPCSVFTARAELIHCFGEAGK